MQVRSQLDREVFKMLENKRPAHAGEDGVASAVEEEFTVVYPKVWLYLTQTRFDDGTPRQPSGVSIFMQHGKWTTCLVEKNWGLILFATSERLDGIWEALEARLADPKADWRVDRKAAGQQAKRVQRPS